VTIFVPIEFRQYPADITPTVEEVPGHLDVTSITPKKEYSLHTEYSASSRSLDSHVLKSLPTLKSHSRGGIPKLWYDETWAQEFADFIKLIVGSNKPPRIIEIHPPFTDYCPTIEQFLQSYSAFEAKIHDTFPSSLIAVENRFGTRYRYKGQPAKGPFLLSLNSDISELSLASKTRENDLRIVLDIPQLFAAHRLSPVSMTPENIKSVLDPLSSCRDRIAGIHIWGKRVKNNKYTAAHHGDLNDFFNKEDDTKNAFLEIIYDLFDDGIPRYFLPETFSNKDSVSIVNDFRKYGFIFSAERSYGE